MANSRCQIPEARFQRRWRMVNPANTRSINKQKLIGHEQYLGQLLREVELGAVGGS